MISARWKNLVIILLWCIGGIFVFSNQAGAFECSSEPTDDLIQYGDTVTCTIDPIGDTDKFRFQGSNGDTIAVQAARQSGGNPCIQLFDPDGVLISGVCGGNTARIDTTLDQTGEHSILVWERDNNSMMGYGLSLERIAPPSASATPIVPGGVLSDAIDPIGDMDLFFFQGSNGDTVAVQAARQSGGNPCIQLFDPDGILISGVCGGNTARIDTTLDQTGEHSILVWERDNNSTMGYGLSLERIVPHSASATPINPGETLSDVITPVGDMDLFFFQGSNGDTVAVQAARQSGGNPCIQLFDPDGILISGVCGGNTARIDTTLDQTGEHSILVWERDNNSTMGYGLSYQCIIGTCPPVPVIFSYTPVTPCKIVDTRNTSAGMIGANTQRNFYVFGDGGTIGAQGGDPAGCPLPPGAPLGGPLAAHINMVAVNPTGKGNLKAFPKGVGATTGLSVNYNSIDTNLANAGTVKTTDGAGTDITVASNFSSAHVTVQVLGYYYPDGDLSYIPVIPCKIVDTRNTSAGMIAANTQRDFYVFGDGGTIGPQGGNPAGCPAPLDGPQAAHINMVAVNPTGKGNLKAFPEGVGATTGLSVNYNAIDTNLANAGTVKTTAGVGTDITVASNFSSAHVTMQVLGYYYPDGDLLYRPVAPCKIVDTRNTPAGMIDAGMQRDFFVSGPGNIIGPQGGNPAGCPAPDNPLAAHINMVAVDPTGKGNLKAFPGGAGSNAGLSVNYNTIDTNLANAGTVKTNVGGPKDITVASDFSSAHVTIQVLGYYYLAP